MSTLPHKNHNLIDVEVPSWHRDVTILKHIKQEKHWVLTTNLPQEDIKGIRSLYEGRFSIEKMFKNVKSGGFDLERVNIKKHDRFKRLLFICCLAYAVMLFAGLFYADKDNDIKKNFSLHLKLLSAFLP